MESEEIMKRLFLSLLFLLLILSSTVNAGIIYINSEILSDTNEIDTTSNYIYDTSVYQIPTENEVQTLTEFIQRFSNIENHNDPYKPATQDYYLYNWITAENINIKIVERLHFYIENNTRKISGIKYVEVK